MNTLPQKQFKRMKREVEEETARGIGYFEGILEHIPSYPLSEAVKELALSGWITPHTDVIDVQNMIVTESIKWMNYQDFKEVAPYLFSYPREQREKDLLVQPVKISREYFEELQANAEELFYLKQDLLQVNNQLDARIRELEMDQLPNGDQVIGVDLEAEEVLLLRTPENAQVEEWEVRKDGLITDYRSNLSEYAQIVDTLLEMKNPEIDTILYEEVINYSKKTWPDSEPIQLPENIKELLNQEGKLDPSYYQIAQFETVKQAYIYGMISPSFQEYFPHYSDFVRNYVEDRESVRFYLESEIGAWYKGSLTELAVIRFDNIDLEKGFNGHQEAIYYIDENLLVHGKLKQAQLHIPDLKHFVEAEELEREQTQDIVAEKEEPEFSL